jgi:F-type H+-transporting ATPase subunit b
MLDINPGLIIWTIITFVIVLAILRFTAWRPILAALAAREEKIRTSLEQAEQARDEAHRLLDENKRQQAQAEAQSQRIVEEGRALGDRLKSEIMEKARTASQQMIDQAKGEIQREKDVALKELRTEVADLAIMAAGKILETQLDPAKHRQLVDSAISSITKTGRV